MQLPTHTQRRILDALGVNPGLVALDSVTVEQVGPRLLVSYRVIAVVRPEALESALDPTE